MHVPELYLARVTECEVMARTAREPDLRSAWNHMAERWRRCADLETRAALAAAQQAQAKRRKTGPK